ncbi:type IV secretory system conjugative DNA transfer family protein [Streptomyces sp. NPDC058268]|uniref:type IV secretory system conjugative DNA transfer family protein n=1 Tax=Streptomyces sp. NPDC058268 TaxID=3346413 RepID=UPI0036E0E599
MTYAMTALAAESPPTGDRAAADETGSRFTDWIISVLPDNGAELQIWSVCGIALLGVLCGIGSRRLAAQGKKERAGLDGAADALGEGATAAFGGALDAAGRFISGQPLWGEPKTSSTFLKSGTVLESAPMDTLDSAVKTADGDGIEQDPPSRTALLSRWVERLPGWAQRATKAWQGWPGVARSAIRAGAVASGAGIWMGPLWTAGAFFTTATAVVVFAMAWRTGGHRTDAQTYGSGLWAALVQLLRLSEEDQAREQTYWVRLSDDLSCDTARVVIRLPLRWLGTEKERQALAHVIHSRLPGEWVAAYVPRGRDPYVTFTPKPPAPPEPELPTRVEWIPSDDPARVYVGETFRGPRYVDTETETPHWGISGGTGDGKTTCLLMPVVHGRQHGALVDCVTMKAAAFKDIEGESGIRVHKTGRQAVAALAEFYVSMKAAESLQGTSEGDQLPGRILVIDEFASFVKSAKIWWKYGLGAKGMPPFEAWFHMVLMQGRSANHKIVIGAHTFTRELFGDTETRDLVGTKGIVGPASNPKWGVTYGLDATRVDYRHEIKGRGVIGVTGSQDIEEIQYAYITPFARDYLRACTPAPSWHVQGQLAPWITEDAMREAEEELAIADFLPGAAFMRGVTLATNKPAPAAKSLAPSSAPVTSQPAPDDGTDDVTAYHAAQPNVNEETQLPVFSLKQACEADLLPVSYGAARKRIERARKAGFELPEAVMVDGIAYYTAKELLQWWTLVTTVKKPSTVPTM